MPASTFLQAAAGVALVGAACAGCAPSAPPAPPAPPASPPVTGRLEPEKIQRLVRQRFTVFRDCYQDGLRRNPELKGIVAVRFVIARDGATEDVSSAGSNLPDAAVVACVVKGFESLRFPRPEGGTVTVTYPIMFDPGEPREAPPRAAASQPFKACDVSREEKEGRTNASILCEGYRVGFSETPEPLTAADAESALDLQARALAPTQHHERISVTIGGVPAWGMVFEEPGKARSEVVLVPIGAQRRRTLLCVARPPTAASLAACERAITVLGSAATFADAVPGP